MSTDEIDITGTLAAKSDQLNADDLIGGAITVEITGVAVVAAPEQPVVITIERHKPWKPNKGTRRILAYLWGANAQKWIGRWVTLFRDPDVKWAGERAGGIRISAMSDIPGKTTIPVTIAKGKKVMVTIEVMRAPVRSAPVDVEAIGDLSLGDLNKAAQTAVKSGGWSREQVVALLGGPAADVPGEVRRELATRLQGFPPVAVAAVVEVAS